MTRADVVATICVTIGILFVLFAFIGEPQMAGAAAGAAIHARIKAGRM